MPAMNALRRVLFQGLWVPFVFVAAVLSCDAAGSGGGGDGPTAPPESVECEAGASTGCICDNGYLGEQTCAADGASFSDCACEVCAPDCDGKACGDDGCGSVCGLCFGDDVCRDGACKMKVECPIGGTGRFMGTQVSDVVWDNQEAGQPFALHQYCGGPKAVWMIKTAGWCTACAELAPVFKGFYDTYAEQGVIFVLIVGEDGAGAPADWQYAQAYKENYDYQDGWIAVSDPHFQKIDAAVKDEVLALPYHLIFTTDMVIYFASEVDTWEPHAEAALKQILAAYDQ